MKHRKSVQNTEYIYNRIEGIEMVNRFGSGKIYSMQDIIKSMALVHGDLTVYVESTACMSVTSDFQSWVASLEDSSRVHFVHCNKPGYSDIIIVLGCQVTDLAVLNDIKTAERLHNENPTAEVYMGGCLAYRFDIQLPDYVKRLGATRSEYTELTDEAMESVNWAKPFWVSEEMWKQSTDELGEGRLFRDMYPLKIGAGCSGQCKYCTIRDTRGEGYEADAYRQVSEFLSHPDIVLISDSPTVGQVKDWCHLAKRYNKPISIRNIEPNVAVMCEAELRSLSEGGLLKIFHCPIQSADAELLRCMNRNINATMKAIWLMQELRRHGTKVATNIIIDYKVKDDEGNTINYHNMDEKWLNEYFDYWSWNPYFDGDWNPVKAEGRFQEYLGSPVELKDKDA